MPDFASLGDRMKFYEKASYPEYLTPYLPTFARLDGKNFHSFTRNLSRPYELNLIDCMTQLTMFLVKETNAVLGYTQSDEITLTWFNENYKSQIFFDGKPQKMISILSAMATLKFNQLIAIYFPDKVKENPLFDCRVWTVPSIEEGANVFVWREQDATRNSIQMSARAYYSHKECENKNVSQLQEMLFKKDINWNNYPDFFKKGTYIIRKQRVINTNTFEDRDGDIYTRSFIEELKIPIITKIKNRAEVIYKNAEPILTEE